MKRIAFAALFCAACAASCSNTTGGALITLPFQAGGVDRDATQPFTFITPTGWTVTLDQALIDVGPFYFNVSSPDTSDFRSGVVIVQATEQQVVNALDPTLYTVNGGANGESGIAVSVEIGLLAPDATNVSSPLIGPLDSTAFAYVAGTAVQGTTTVPFQGQIIVDSSLVTATETLADLQRIKGAAVQLTFTAAPQTLELRVDPTHWFDQSDFSQIAKGTAPAGGFSWTTASTFGEQLLEGVKGESSVYLFDLVSGSGP